MDLLRGAAVRFLLVVLVLTGIHAQRRVRVRRPIRVDYGRVLTMIRATVSQEFRSLRDEFDEKLNATKTQLDDARHEIEFLGAENHELKAKNEELSANLQEISDSINDEQEIFEGFRNQIASLQAENTEINQTLRAMAEQRETDMLPVEMVDVGVDTGVGGGSIYGDDDGAPVETVDVGTQTDGGGESGVQGLREELNQRLSDTRHDVAKAIYPPCDFVYEGNCYYADVRYYKKLDYAGGETVCASRHGIVAYPVNEEHYIRLMYTIRTKMPSGLRYVYIWLGLLQNPKTGDVTTPDREEAPFLKWYSGQPTLGNDENRLYMYVTQNALDDRQGMFDDYEGYNYHGVVCQYQYPPLNDPRIVPLMADMDWFTYQYHEEVFKYKLFMEKVDYQTAKTECESHDAILASHGMRIHDVRRAAISRVAYPGGEDTWVGLDDLQEQDVWMWNDGESSTRDETDWYRTEPNDGEQHCGHMKHGTKYNFKLADDYCWREMFYLCEKVE